MIIPAGFAQINFKGSGTGYARGWQVAIGVDNDADWNAVQLASGCGSAFVEHMLPVMSNQCALTSVLAKLGPNETGVAFEESYSEDGGVASQAQSSQAAVLVTKLTTHGGRKGRGRMFMPGVTEGQTDGGGLLTSAALTAWQAAVDGFLEELETFTAPMVLLHADDATTPYAVINLQVANLFASQRRRIRRVGGRRSNTP